MSNYNPYRAEAYETAVSALAEAKSELNTSYFLGSSNCHFPTEGEQTRDKVLEFIELRRKQLAELENALTNWYAMGEAGWHEDAYARLVESNREMDRMIAARKEQKVEESK